MKAAKKDLAEDQCKNIEKGVTSGNSKEAHNTLKALTKIRQHKSAVIEEKLCRINSIRHHLSVQATKTLVSAFVLSRLDFCNFLLSGCPQYLLNRLQKVRNIAARLFLKALLKAPRTDHITPHLRTLNWLPIDARIKYKLCSLCFGAITSTGPVYLSDLLKIYTSSRQLRCSADFVYCDSIYQH